MVVVLLLLWLLLSLFYVVDIIVVVAVVRATVFLVLCFCSCYCVSFLLLSDCGKYMCKSILFNPVYTSYRLISIKFSLSIGFNWFCMRLFKQFPYTLRTQILQFMYNNNYSNEGTHSKNATENFLNSQEQSNVFRCNILSCTHRFGKAHLFHACLVHLKSQQRQYRSTVALEFSMFSIFSPMFSAFLKE